MSAISSVVGIDESDPRSKVDLTLWLFFQIAAGNVGLPLLVATFLFAKSVNRHPTLVNMCITWTISGISSSLLLYAGKQSGPEPSHALCITQASLLYGVPPMCSLAAFALVFTVWSSFNASVRVEPRNGKIGLYALLVTPYIVWVAFILATAILASQDVNSVNRHRRFFYCSIQNSPLSNAMAVFSAIVCLISLLLEIYILIRLSRNWRGLSSPSNWTDDRRGLDKQLIGRLFIFSGFLLVALVFSTVSILSPQTVVPDMFAASIGMAVFIVFGTQTDVLRVWAFWLPKATPEQSQDSSCYVPRELKYLESALDSSFDIGSEKSTLAPFEDVGQCVTLGSRDPTSTIITLPLNDGLQNARGSRRGSGAPIPVEVPSSKRESITRHPEEAISPPQGTIQSI